MLNPWMAFPFQAARLGWEAQKAALRLMGFAGGRADVERTDAEANPLVAQIDVTQIDPLAKAQMAAESAQVKKPTAPKSTSIKANGRRVATKITKAHKKRGRVKRRRLSK